MSNSSTVSELEALVGLDSAKRLVSRLSVNGDLVHAVLFYGVEGTGKRSLSRILAKAWMCLEPTTYGACGKCRSCHSFANGNAVDFFRIVPKPPSQIIKQGAIVPPKVRAHEEPEGSLQEFLRTPPMLSLRKVGLIESADRMNPDAANAFLKTLEEPPDFAKLILTTDTIGSMAPTVLSRCVTIKCEFAKDTTTEDLTHGLMAAEHGGPGRVRLVLENSEWYESMRQFALGLSERRLSDALKASEEFRAICEAREDRFNETRRAANAEGLRVLANLLESHSIMSVRLQPVVEAHRRILGNGAFGGVLDSLFAQLLA